MICTQKLGLSEMRSILVDHCKHSFGLRLATPSGWSFVFSGDTRRCDNVAAAARGATLLVHEATFESGMDEEAARKKHSTISDALSVRPRLCYLQWQRQSALSYTLLAYHVWPCSSRIPSLRPAASRITLFSSAS